MDPRNLMPEDARLRLGSGVGLEGEHRFGLLDNLKRPSIPNSHGGYSTEYSITVRHPLLNNGEWTNIPSIWGGQFLNQDQAINAAIASGYTFDSFESVSGAGKAAGERSNLIGLLRGNPQGVDKAGILALDHKREVRK